MRFPQALSPCPPRCQSRPPDRTVKVARAAPGMCCFCGLSFKAGINHISRVPLGFLGRAVESPFGFGVLSWTGRKGKVDIVCRKKARDPHCYQDVTPTGSQGTPEWTSAFPQGSPQQAHARLRRNACVAGRSPPSWCLWLSERPHLPDALRQRPTDQPPSRPPAHSSFETRAPHHVTLSTHYRVWSSRLGRMGIFCPLCRSGNWGSELAGSGLQIVMQRAGSSGFPASARISPEDPPCVSWS